MAVRYRTMRDLLGNHQEKNGELPIVLATEAGYVFVGYAANVAGCVKILRESRITAPLVSWATFIPLKCEYFYAFSY